MKNDIENFLAHLEKGHNASHHTLRNYKLDLTEFIGFLEKEKTSEVTKRTVRSYLAHLHEKGLKRRSIVRKLSSLRSFFKFRVQRKCISFNPFDLIETPKLEKTLPFSLTYDMVERLFNLPDTTSFLGFRDRTILELFYSSGLRLSELCQMNREDIHFGNLTMRIKGKGKKERLIPITKNAADWIKKYLTHSLRHADTDVHKAQKDPKALFLNKWGERISQRSVDRLFKKYLLESGIVGKITPHTIRHTIATHWLEKGMDLKTIQEILGHSNLSTTTIYTKVSQTLKREVYEKAHPMERQRKIR